MASHLEIRLMCLSAAVLAVFLSRDVSASPAVLSPLDALDYFSQGAPLRFNVTSGACSLENGQWPLHPFGDSITSGFVSYYDDHDWVFSFGFSRMVNGSIFNTTGVVKMEAQTFVYDNWRIIFQLSAFSAQGKQITSGEIMCNITTNGTRGVTLTTEATSGVVLYSYSDVVKALGAGYSLSFAVNLEGCNYSVGRHYKKLFLSHFRPPQNLDKKISVHGNGYFSVVGQISHYCMDPEGRLGFIEVTPNVGMVEIVDVMVLPTNRTSVNLSNAPSFRPMGSEGTVVGDLPSGFDCSLAASGTFRVYQR